MSVETKESVLETMEPRLAVRDIGPVSHGRITREAEAESDSAADPRSSEGLSAAGQTATPHVRWTDVSYGGVRFLVGSYGLRRHEDDSEGQSNNFEDSESDR